MDNDTPQRVEAGSNRKGRSMRGLHGSMGGHPAVAFLLVVCLVWPCQVLASRAETGPTRQTPYRSHQSALLRDYTHIEAQLRRNQDPFLVQSQVEGKSARGAVRGVLPYNFAAVQQVMTSPIAWCNAIILHINVKACTTKRTPGNGAMMTVYIGNARYATPEHATAMHYTYRIRAKQPGFVHVTLRAQTGPMGTANAAIDVQAVSVGPSGSFVHLTYAIELGFVARTLLRTYLATIGRNKVGFTVQANGDPHAPQYIGGIAGIVERNTMRYFFAFDAYLSSRDAPAEHRVVRSMHRWYDFTLKYKRQLYEIDRATYIAQKTQEQRNQHALQEIPWTK